MHSALAKLELSEILQHALTSAPVLVVPETRAELVTLAAGDTLNDEHLFEVAYHVPGQGRVVEATVAQCKNGVSINFTDIYMRRRDPDCMVIGDQEPTDKPMYSERFQSDFDTVREETFAWLAEQELIVMPFWAGGGQEYGYPAILVCPKNAAFFAGGLADLQGFIPQSQIPTGFKPQAAVYVAPPFRHTHFDEQQVVVHNRLPQMHEIFSYNLYPGPSAKKGIYGMLLNIGEQEDWVTVHASTVRVITPYDNVITIMHEGASGGGKSEMLEQMHWEKGGMARLAENLETGDVIRLELKETCALEPITDDMALCQPVLQKPENQKLMIYDAENGWFLRIDHIKQYGTDPHYEGLTIHPPEPLIFMNIDGKPGATCLIWEHTMDEPDVPCPNPRVIMPRSFVPGVVQTPVEVDLRSFGVRTPPSTREHPTYGIIGLFHVLPPALAWLWRLVAPRGHANPSITDTQGMTSEGVGSYWPFATGRMVTHANLLLDQVVVNKRTRYILTPNQHIGVYKVGFMPQWITREYLARRGSASFRPDSLVTSRCPVLGFSVRNVKVDGTYIYNGLLQPHLQPELGHEAYDQGSEQLTSFFKQQLQKFYTEELNPLGREIISCCLDDGKAEDYIDILPMRY